MIRDFSTIAACLVMTMTACIPDIPALDPSDASENGSNADPFATPDNHVESDSGGEGFFIDKVAPPRGDIGGGVRVTIEGAGFEAGSTVVFGGSAGLETVVANSGLIYSTTPSHPAGSVAVSVIRPDNKTARLEAAFFYETPMEVESVTPALGPFGGGTPITVRGKGFLADSRIIIGGHLAIGVEIVSESKAIATTPPGTVGERDVTVVNSMGSAIRQRAFTYLAPPMIDHCEPAVIPYGIESDITVVGSGLAHIEAVSTSRGTMEVSRLEDNAIVTRYSPDGIGGITVSVNGPGGSTTLANCLFVIPPGDVGSNELEVLAVSPSFGVESGGNAVDVLVNGLEETAYTLVGVDFGNENASMTSMSDVGDRIRVKVPAGSYGFVDVSVQTRSTTAVLQDAYFYHHDVAITAITPDHGPADGGTKVTIQGTGLDQLVSVFVGPFPAQIVAGPTAESVEAVTTPSGLGRVDVVGITALGARVFLADSFEFTATSRELIAATPNAGSIAGGTRVLLAGTGFSDGMAVFFGQSPGTVESWDPGTLSVYSPHADQVGIQDVTVYWPDHDSRTIKNAYRYFDPTGLFGGVWGEPISGAVNVTVLDGYNSAPIASALVVMGPTAETSYSGRTDVRGQITFSADDVFGPVQVSASREDYSAFSIVGVDAENITLFIDPLVTPPSTSSSGGSTSYTLPPGTVTGAVLGADKYLLPPAGSCDDRELVNGSLCAPCTDNNDCDAGSSCINPKGDGLFCAEPCETDADCPDGYSCWSTELSTAACQPSSGRIEVQCATSTTSRFSSPSDPGPGYLASSGTYAINSRLGDVTVYCIGGVRRFESGEFDPVVMGVKRHVGVASAKVISGEDVKLDIVLDREFVVRWNNAPGGAGGPNVHSLYVALNLGSEGTIRLWPVMTEIDSDRFIIPNMPANLDGDLDGAVVTLYAVADSQTSDTTPYSVTDMPEFTPMKSTRSARVGASGVELLDPGEMVDAIGGCAFGETGGVILGSGGRAYLVDGAGAVSALPNFANITLRGCSSGQERILAVGDRGTIVSFDGTVVEAQQSPTTKRLNAVAMAGDKTAWAGGEQVLLHQNGDGVWSEVPYAPKVGINGVAALPDGRMIAVGDGGVVIRGNAEITSCDSPYPTKADLMAVTFVNGRIWAAGTEGTVLTGLDGEALKAVDSQTGMDMLTFGVRADQRVFIAGAGGAMMEIVDNALISRISNTFTGEVTTLLPGRDQTMIAMCADVALMGPFLHPAVFSSPPENRHWTNRVVSWTRDDEVEPSLTYTRFYGMDPGYWTVITDGSTRVFELPDLTVLAPDMPDLPNGNVTVRSIQILRDNFDINSFDETQLYSSGWLSWTVDEYLTIR